MKTSLYISFIILISVSCRKKHLDVPFSEIEGEYEWYYSFKEIGDSYSFDMSEDQHGIRITKNGHVKLFGNSELQKNYRILNTTIGNTGWTSILTDDKEDPIYFNVKGDTLSTWVYPYSDYRNYYVKKK